MEEQFFGSPPKSDGAPGSSSAEFPRNLLLNNTGLRAGWRLLVYAVIFFALMIGARFLLIRLFRPAHGDSPLWWFSAELIGLLAAFVAAWIMATIEGRSVGAYGLPVTSAFAKHFGQGCLFGFCEICLLIGIIAAFGGYSFGGLAEHGGEIAKWALFWGAFFLVVGSFEEFFFRGYALYTLADGIGFWPAAILLAVCFGAVHRQNSGENWVGLAGVLLVGLFWSFTLRRTGSLWFALGMHATFDFGETFLFSVPDSGMVFPGHLSNATLRGPSWLTGGTPGPEASVIDFLILIVFFLVFDRLYPGPEVEKRPHSADQAA